MMFETADTQAMKVSKCEGLEWDRIHVGDDQAKDVGAAESAGWRGVLWDGEKHPDAILKVILGT